MDSVEIVSRALSVSRAEASRILRSRSTRRMEYKGIVYYVLKREIKGYPEGTSILYREGLEPIVVPGYPQIKRILLLRRALERHFRDRIVVEEKMNGYNVRLLSYGGEIYALTRGGFICPYTTHRLRIVLDRELPGTLESLGNPVLYGEVVGMENPYTRHRYPEAPDFSYYVFDVMGREGFLPVTERRRLVDELGLQNIRQLGVIGKSDAEQIFHIIDSLEREGREGIVFKDPVNRVPPLKYTTSSTNIGDIREGMKFFFDEGRTYVFPRVLREIFLAFERGEEYLDREKMEELGESLIHPSLECVRKVDKGLVCAEEFTLRFYDRGIIDDFIEHMHRIGVLVVMLGLWPEESSFRARFMKPKKTFSIVRNILDTGLSPLD